MLSARVFSVIFLFNRMRFIFSLMLFASKGFHLRLQSEYELFLDITNCKIMCQDNSCADLSQSCRIEELNSFKSPLNMLREHIFLRLWIKYLLSEHGCGVVY